jgi:Zn finger protein HypA/HybF involved in hydrogenase expression
VITISAALDWPVHELSLAIEIGRLAEEKLGASVGRCVTVGVEVGADSGVEPSALEFCLEVVLSHPPWTGARPAITRPDGDAFQVTYFEIEDDDSPDD